MFEQLPNSLWVRSDLKGKFNEFHICEKCNYKATCLIHDSIFYLNIDENLATPVFQCDRVKELKLDIEGSPSDYCLCFVCKRHNLINRPKNCPAAQKVSDLDDNFQVVTPVLGCKAFEERGV